MMYQERLFKILQFPHVSEKASFVLEQSNTVVFKVAKYATKSDIKDAVSMLFSVRVNSVHTVVVIGKTKGPVNNLGHRSSWKKAYIVLEKDQKINLINKLKEKI